MVFYQTFVLVPSCTLLVTQHSVLILLSLSSVIHKEFHRTEWNFQERQQHNNFEPVVVIVIVATINKLVAKRASNVRSSPRTAPIIPHSQNESTPVPRNPDSPKYVLPCSFFFYPRPCGNLTVAESILISRVTFWLWWAKFKNRGFHDHSHQCLSI